MGTFLLLVVVGKKRDKEQGREECMLGELKGCFSLFFIVKWWRHLRLKIIIAIVRGFLVI